MSEISACKAKLPLPDLWRRLDMAGAPRKSMKSPFRDDRNDSFSVFEHNGKWFWKDHGAGDGGDEVDLICMARAVDKGEAIRIYHDLAGVDYVQKHQKPAFVVARPPGHHAISNRGMGFCLFSNAAIAAYYALTLPGIERVGILDWDVHHGNGTESLVEDNPHILYCSIHQSPAYPGTGRGGDRGKHDNILNLPMLPGSNFKDYQPIFENQILPFFAAFQPQLMIVSAGYDANRADPLADINLEPADYGQFSRYLLPLTSHLLFGLEGGYDLDALALSVVETIAPLLSI
jgi:acetoin utilization deacetylase AcuC-like enzyme